MKEVIDKQTKTIDLLQSKSLVLPTPENKTTSEAVKKLNENMKNKTAEVNDIKAKNRKLAEELSEAQNKLNDDTRTNDEPDKCVKLTKVISTKSKEITELKVENKNLTEKNNTLTNKLNEVSSKVTALEVKNTRLENQVENLIEAIGKKDTRRKPSEDINAPQKSPSTEAAPVQKSVKCKHNDKAICLRKESCQYIHYKLVCGEFSKFVK